MMCGHKAYREEARLILAECSRDEWRIWCALNPIWQPLMNYNFWTHNHSARVPTQTHCILNDRKLAFRSSVRYAHIFFSLLLFRCHFVNIYLIWSPASANFEFSFFFFLFRSFVHLWSGRFECLNEPKKPWNVPFSFAKQTIVCHMAIVCKLNKNLYRCSNSISATNQFFFLILSIALSPVPNYWMYQCFRYFASYSSKQTWHTLAIGQLLGSESN